jgi:hypothetical protein
MKIIIWMHPKTGTVAMTTAAPSYEGTLDDLAKIVVANGVHYKIVEHTEMPTDLTYRDAWAVELNEFNSDGVGAAVEY